MLINSNFRTNQSVSFNAKKKAPKKPEEEIRTGSAEWRELNNAQYLYKVATRQTIPEDGRMPGSLMEEEDKALKDAIRKYGSEAVRDNKQEEKKGKVPEWLPIDYYKS